MEKLNCAPCVVQSNMSTKVLLNFEIERKKELERRRKLRILQVRQQANDFASKIRDNIRAETICQRKRLLQSKKKQSQQSQLAELAQLNELYKLCLETIGESHKEAAKQPNMNELKAVESAQITADANVRGVKARRNQQEKNELHRQIAEAPVKQKIMSRNRENLRSYFISSLPKESFGGKGRSRLTKDTHITSSKPNTGTHILQELQSNLCSQQPNTQGEARTAVEEIRKQPTSIKTKDSEQVKKQTVVSLEPHNLLVEACSSPRTAVTKDCPCDYVVCGCHDSPKPSPIRRRSRSEPGSVSSENIFGIEDIRPKQPKPRTRSCSPQSVRTLNYRDIGNVYEATERSFARVTHHSSPPKATDQNPASNSADVLLNLERNETEELKKKTKERSTKALHRERLKKEFKQLLQDLGNLNREKQKIKSKVYQRDRDITAKNETKQRKLTNAFEELLHSSDPSPHKVTGKDKPTQGQFDESSPPTLNLAKYHQIKMTTPPRSLVKQITSVEEVTVSQTSRAQDIQSPQSRGGATGGASGWSSSSPPRTPSPRRDQSPSVTVRTNPSGNVHLTIKVKDTPHKKKCRRESPSSSTSYFSPPENLTPSQKLLLDALLIQVNKQALNEDLRLYIDKLLNLSRESIDRLHSPDRVDRARSPPNIEEDIAELGIMTEEYIDRVHTLIDMFENLEPIQSPERMFSPPPSAGPTRRPLPSRIPTPIMQPQPVAPPLPPSTQQPARDRRTPSPGYGRRIPRKPTTPPMQRRSPPITPRQPQPPPESAQSRIPISPRYPSPPQQSRQATPVPTSGRTQIQTPFQLSSNLLPDPRDVFGQLPAAAHPALSPDTVHEDSDSTFDPFQGLPPLPTDLRPARRGDSTIMREDYNLSSPTIHSSFDLSTELKKRGMYEDFAHLRQINLTKQTEATDGAPMSDLGGGFGGQDDWEKMCFVASDTNLQNASFNCLNEIRKKLSKMQNHQYQVIENLQKDYAIDEHQIDNLLKRVMSDPLEDSNAASGKQRLASSQQTRACQSPTERSSRSPNQRST